MLVSKKKNKIASLQWASLLIIPMLCTFLFVSRASAADNINIYIDDLPMVSDTKPYLEQGTTMTPIRFVSEQLGASVTWKDPQITINRNGNQVTLTLNKKTAQVNGKEVNLNMAPQLKSGRTFVPLRFVSEALESKVDYKNSKVYIYSSQKAITDKSGIFYETDNSYFIAGYQNQDTGGLHKVTKDFINSDEISPEYLRFARQINGDMYYNKDLKLIKLDMTTKEETVLDTNVTFLSSKGEWLYYITGEESGTLIKLKYDGTSKKVLSKGGVTSIDKITDASIAYSVWGQKTMCLDFSTGKSQQIADKPLSAISGGYGYYVETTNHKINGDSLMHLYYNLYRLDLVTGQKSKVFTESLDTQIKDVQVHNGWIYYITGIPVVITTTSGGKYIDYNSGSLNRVFYDGSQKKSLTDAKIAEYVFFDKGIFYRQFPYEGNGSKYTDKHLYFDSLK